jgi:transposase
MRTALSNQIRGLLKTFGVALPPGKGGSFERLVLNGVADDHCVRLVIESLLVTWRHLTLELKKLNREIARAARAIPICRREEYNGERPHSSLGYRTPNEFAETLRSSLLHG